MMKKMVRVLVVVMMVVGMYSNAYAADNAVKADELSDKEIVAEYYKQNKDYQDMEFVSVELMESELGEEYIGFILYDEEGYPVLGGSVSREYAIHAIER